ncbi:MULTISPECIES: helix-turn-helix domain-containing protein [unclassified Rhizobium]|uniref:helix-turn-helix domain-containing protein n=1 Tax=unclassified Rhizobium TaxID=2613769 RepID=UPI001612EBE1|nr:MULTISPECIES: helix-turn-helix domain-containing protein [unclassified Rhizobium]MBB3386181.1 transcriptional regulator with XRE-family HTH domain [Rhizobium sp. BK098]MBB3571157.1 transcriptional regulator with XRE-family HTH domain [Rhizobium sp. BK491]MBB3617885.1 transcriptional regulator with XRE-family HTH domain [Rhizobium sp. BK609]MBB3683662.1 transcriptional regulator with XRE-family HTH domain [Rhizobium sp. BK612]
MGMQNHEIIGVANGTTIGQALKQARENVGYSVDDLAVTCGLTTLEIDQIESGVETDELKVRRISIALSVDWTNFV